MAGRSLFGTSITFSWYNLPYMDIIFSLDSLSTTGGGQVILRTVQSATEPVLLICPKGTLANEAEQFCSVHRLENSKKTFQTITEIRNCLKSSTSPITFHMHGISALWLGILATTGFPVKNNYTEHLLTKEYALQSKLRYALQLFMYRLCARKLFHIYCVSHAVLRFLRDGLKIPQGKLSVAFNPFPTISNLPKRLHKENMPFKIVSIGNLTYIKNYTLLLRILPQVASSFLISVQIYGDGVERPHLEKLVRQLNLSNTVTFMGATPHDELLQNLARADLYVQTSISESFGYGIAEAMSVGLPVVAFAVGGIPEMVKDQQTGLLVPPYDEGLFASAIERVLQDPVQASQWGEQGLQYLRQLSDSKAVS